MTLTVEEYGSGNRIEIGRAEHAALAGRIVFTGDGAVVSIGAGTVDTGVWLEVGSGATVRIGGDNHLGALFVHAAAGTHVALGSGMGLNGTVRLLLHEPGRITVGDGCLIADGVDISVSDMHPIYDAVSGARINPAADVAIGARVWIGARSLVLKGSVIGADSVIGAGSLVAGRIPAGCIAAGNPARVVRRGVRWAMDLPG